MPSPFPGMNPYLEHDDAWHNFHEQFPTAAATQLNAQVGSNYFVKVDEHIYIHELPDEQRRWLRRADVSLGRNPGVETTSAETATMAAPRQVLLPIVDRVGLSYVEIRDRRSRRLVTVIELLSPSNKHAGSDREQYEAKRAELLSSQAHFIELDLLRGWKRMPGIDENAGGYCILMSRYEARPKADLWLIGLRKPIPPIPVPLWGGDADVTLDVQAILHHLYDSIGYAKFIYQSEPEPPLSPDDAAWAHALIPEGARSSP